MKILASKGQAFLYVVPVLVLSGALIYYCIGFTGYASLTDWDGLSNTMKFIGARNYGWLLQSDTFWVAVRNTLLFMVVTVGVQAGLGLLLAVVLKEKLPGSSVFKAIYFLPIAMAPVIIASIFRIMLDANVGTLNTVLDSIGLGSLAQDWLGDPHWALVSIMCVNIFEWMGFSMMIYYAGLMAIPPEIYEAAELDGAGFWTKLFRITIPQLRATTNVLIVLGIVGSLKTFDIVKLTTSGGPGTSTEFLATFLYRLGLNQFRGGRSAAVGVMILVLAVVLSLLQVRAAKARS